MRLCSYGEQLSQADNSDISGSQEKVGRNCAFLRPQRRHPCHVYLDYSFCYVVTSMIPLIFELFQSNRGFSSLFSKPLLIITVMIGGFLLSLANIAMQWSTFFGAPLTTVVALQSSLCVVLGTSINYLLQPDRTNRPNLLFIGVISFLIAILSASKAQTWYQRHHQYQDSFDNNGNNHIMLSDGIPLRNYNDGNGVYGDRSNIVEYQGQIDNDDEKFCTDDTEVLRNVRLGFIVAFLGGVCIGFFTPAFNIAVNDPLNWYANNGGGLPVPCANLWFAFAFAACSVIANLSLMKCTKYSSLAPTGWQNYLLENVEERKQAWTAGIICAFGNWLQFEGGFLAGFAAADMVQAFPLIATLWDYFLFNEFHQTTRHVAGALVLMYISYLIGISMLAFSISA